MILEKYKKNIKNNANDCITKYLANINLECNYKVYIEEAIFNDIKDFLIYFDEEKISIINKDMLEEEQNIKKNILFIRSKQKFVSLMNTIASINLDFIDIYEEIGLEIDLLNDEIFEKLWKNFELLENKIPEERLKNILKKTDFSYVELFENLLKKANYFKNEYCIALVYSKHYPDTLGKLSEQLGNSIIFNNFDELSNVDNSFFGFHYLKYFRFIKLFVSTESFLFLPNNSTFISVSHGIIDDPYVVKSNKKGQEYYFPKKYFRKPDITLVSSTLLQGNNNIYVGYLKLDKFISYYEKNKCISNNILIVTSIHTIESFSKLSPITINPSFINSILKENSDRKVILRPHPLVANTSEINSIFSENKQFDNLELDGSMSYLDTFISGEIFITDSLTGTAYTYAFGTLKPVIFYIPKIKEYMYYYKNLDYVKYQSVVGDVATNEKQLCKLIKKYQNDKAYVKEKSKEIKKLRSKLILNLGKSASVTETFFNNYININSVNNGILFNLYKKFEDNARKRIDNYFSKLENKTIGVYGSGDHFEKVIIKLFDVNKLRIKCFFDSNINLRGRFKNNIPIFVNGEGLNDVDCVLISSKVYENDIKAFLIEKGVTHIYTLYDFFEKDISILLNKKIYMLNLCKIQTQILSEKDLEEISNKNFKNYQSILEYAKSIYTLRYVNSLHQFYMEKDTLLTIL